MILEDGMLLYHGSYAPIEKIDLSKCADGKDCCLELVEVIHYEQ